MDYKEFQRVGRQMIAEARARFRVEAYALCRSDAERAKADRLESAVGEVSPEEAVLAFRRWLEEEHHDKPLSRHGKDCAKVAHSGSGYLHDAADDRPYDVDGTRYCGRCHAAL